MAAMNKGHAAAAKPSKNASVVSEEPHTQHSQEMLEKKIQKVVKLLKKEETDSKQYKKLEKKRLEYQKELEQLQNTTAPAAVTEDDNDEDNVPEVMTASEASDSLDLFVKKLQKVNKKLDKETEGSKMHKKLLLKKEQYESELKQLDGGEEVLVAEQARYERHQQRRREKLKKEQEEEAAGENDPSEKKEPESEEDEEQVEEKGESEQEQRRREVLEAYRLKREEKERKKELAKQKAEKLKEFKMLKKKLDKVESMMRDDEANGGKKHSKLVKKRNGYVSSLEEFDEWHEELEQKRKDEEIRKQREEQERLRKEEEERQRVEQERLRKEEEERLAAEQARREAEEEERRQRELIEAKEREEREAAEAKERAEREAAEAIARAKREATEAKERAEREAREREERERQEKVAAKKREQEAAKAKAAAEQREREKAERAARIAAGEEVPEEETSSEVWDRENLPLPHSANTKKILQELELNEKFQLKLVKTLNQNGIAVSEDIPYEVAKDKIAEVQEQMKELMSSSEDAFIVQKKMFALEEEMSKYVTAMMLTDEYVEEQERLEQEWDDENRDDNLEALRKLRRHMHVNIKNMTEEELTTQPTPNGKTLPKVFAKKFKRTNVLQLIRANPDDLERMHPSLLEGIRTTGLTLTERRALYEHLKDIGNKWQSMQADKSIERKWMWFSALKSKFKESLAAYKKHVAEYGPPGNHPYAKRNDPGGGGCPLLGNQCPVKADSVISYEEDYGYTAEAVYESSEGGRSGRSISPSPGKSRTFDRSTRQSSKQKEVELMESIRAELDLQEPESDIDTKLLRELFFGKKKTLSLEKQLTQNGLAVPKNDDIPYSMAKAKAAELTEGIKTIANKMGSCTDAQEMSQLEKEYGKLSDELEKYTNAMMLTKEWAQEQLKKEEQWEENVRLDNEEALRKLRRHMPVDIRDMSEDELTQIPTPNGKTLPLKIVRKFKRTNILLLLRVEPRFIEPMHPSSIESLRSTGLTLTERRALHEHLKEVGAKWKALSNDKMAERKWMWHESLKSKFKELIEKYEKHVEQHGPPGTKPNPTDPPFLKQDLAMDYSEDYGFPEGAHYKVENVAKSNLLTIEDLERRRKNSDDSVNIYEEVNPHQAAPPPRPVVQKTSPKPKGKDASRSRPNTPNGGLLAAINARNNDGNQKAPTSTPAKKSPAMGGGLLAAIQARGKK